MEAKKNIVILTGAGISAESGIQTFRGTDGLWEGHNVMDVASPKGFKKNPRLVLEFYNKRRKQLLKVEPNSAHKDLVRLEKKYNVNIITQNVDDLHERAGSKNVLHLHGELLKVRSSINHSLIYSCKTDINIGDLCEEKHQLRPHIVWFGESVPLFEKAVEIVAYADILVIIGTSMQVYPAASLIQYVVHKTPIYFINPKVEIDKDDFKNLTIIKEKATTGVNRLVKNWLSLV